MTRSLELHGDYWWAVHGGQDFYLNLIRQSDGAIVETYHQIIDDDDVDISYSGVLVDGESYTLDFYADHNGDTLCTQYPDDHVWHMEFGPVTGDESQTIDHDGSTIDNAGCDSF